jgi:hypothetical protein
MPHERGVMAMKSSRSSSQVHGGELRTNRDEPSVAKNAVECHSVESSENRSQCILSASELHAFMAKSWKESADTSIANIESFTEALSDGELSIADARTFQRNLERIIPVLLLGLANGPYEDEIRLLNEVQRVFYEALSACSTNQEDGPPTWSLAQLIAWWSHVDLARLICEQHCRAWRQHLDGILSQQRQRALDCIEEIERRIPLLRSHLLSHLPEQYEAIEKCMIMDAKLTAYASDSSSLRLFSDAIVGPPNDESDALKKVAAFAKAVIGNDLSGQKDWLQQVNSLHWVEAEAGHLASLYDNDGRLDSHEKFIHEVACIDPFYPDTEDPRAAGTIDKAALEVARHPDVAIEIQNLDGALKTVGLNARQRKALLMRRNGEIMSRREVNEWKRAQRAISGNRSKLVQAIAAATKKRVIKAPRISGGSYSGVIREGAGYTLPLPDEDKPTQNSPSPRARKWFDSTPPPISCTFRKTKHLFKKVSS